MSQSRDQMIAELQCVVVPVLGELGFKGSFPHFRRTSTTQIDLLTFQFSTGGGQFVVEIGKFPATDCTLYGELIPAERVKLRHLLRSLRLGAKDENSDHWVRFENADLSAVAESVVPFLGRQADAWWTGA